VLLLREDDRMTEPALNRANIRKPIFRLRRELSIPTLPGLAFAFCGIAHPAEFFGQLRAHGASLAGTMAFRDHHPFAPRDIEMILTRAKGASALLTTEKDLIRLSPDARAQLSSLAPLLSADLRVLFADEAGLAALLGSRLHPA
jgi:tetraacyldisaccharide 4'-kinase